MHSAKADAEQDARQARSEVDAVEAARAKAVDDARDREASLNAARVDKETRLADAAEAEERRAMDATRAQLDKAVGGADSATAMRAVATEARAAADAARAATADECAAVERAGTAKLEEVQATLQVLKAYDDPNETVFLRACGVSAFAGFLLFSNQFGGGFSFFSFFGAALGAFTMATFGVKIKSAA